MFATFVEAKQGLMSTIAGGYRLTFDRPSSAVAGDTLVAVFGFAGAAFPALAKSVEWSDETFAGAANASFRVCRRMVTDAEPASYAFDAIAGSVIIGTLLAYRSLPESAALVSSGALDFGAVVDTMHRPPAIAVARPTDLYVYGGMVINAAGVGSLVTVSDAAGFGTSPTRSSHVQAIGGIDIRRLGLGEIVPKLPAGGLAQQAIHRSGTSIGCAFAFVLAGAPAIGADLKFSPIVPGTIGLPVKGI